jgi:C-terminal processing protease CtpA/Prc
VIVAIDDVPTAGKSPQDCAALIRGEHGRRVRLDLVNPTDEETLTVEITRGTFRTGEG